MDVTLRLLNNDNAEFKQIHKWCKNKFVYEWFEQRVLSYDEIVKKCKAQDCLKVEKEGLYVLYIENKACAKHINAPMLKDSAFIRDKIPMTKEEIRHIVINKLQLKEDSIFFDIGGGTGSISIEAAMLDRNIKVFTFENNVEAVRLIEKNIEHFIARCFCWCYISV